MAINFMKKEVKTRSALVALEASKIERHSS